MKQPRSYLFVPGQRPDRFAKAASCGADAVILDLEDAVGPDAKDTARGHVQEWITQGSRAVVRINGVEAPWHEDDLVALHETPAAAVMVPKADPEALKSVAARLPGQPLIALVESVAGLATVRTSVQIPQVDRLAFGNLDFGTDARIPDGGGALDPARFELVVASRLGKLPLPIDGVTTILSDAEAIARDVSNARARGFGAKLCIHPAQVSAVNEGFSPTSSEVEWAQNILAALEAAAGSVVQVDGKMVDSPLITRAREILEDAKSHQPNRTMQAP